jgi:transcriptional regulator with XRE-family HTH domain
MDSMQRCGTTFRAVRIKRGWRQVDLARRARVHRSVVSNIERGHLDGITLGTLLRVARTLEVHVSITTRWRGGDLDRLISARHSGLHEAVARWFGAQLPDWVLAPEVSYAIAGERGVIDILAWNPKHRALLVIELKTDVVDVNDLVGSMDRRCRLAWKIARERGWDPVTVSAWVIVAGGRTNRARLEAHRTMLRNAFPVDGREVAGWLRNPDQEVRALSLSQRVDVKNQPGGLAARHRVRVG